MEKCRCTLAQKMVGDGCRYCNPQEYIDRLHNQVEDAEADAERYRWIAAHCRSTSEHWGGRWSIVIDGPAPKTHNSEDDFDAAIDAARAKQVGEPT